MGHKRFTDRQKFIVNYLEKQPNFEAENSKIAQAYGNHLHNGTPPPAYVKSGAISDSLRILEEKGFIEKTKRGLSTFTGKKTDR